MVLPVVTGIARALVNQQWCFQPAPWVVLLNFVPLSALGAVKHLLLISWQVDVSHDKFYKYLCSQRITEYEINYLLG